MGIFLIYIFAILAFFSLSELFNAPKRLKMFLFGIAFALLWIAASFRSGPNDIVYYIRAFIDSPVIKDWNKMEHGYLFFNYLFKLLGFNAHYFIAFFAGIAIFSMLRFFYSYTPYFLF